MEDQDQTTEMEYASVWTRLGAILIDGLLLLPFYIPIFAMIPMLEEDGEMSTLAGILLFLAFIGIVVFGFWNTIVRMGKTGQSLGRKFLHIAVLTADGEPIGIGKAALREIIGRWISGLICYIGYLIAFWDKDRQMLHDKMANCYVYYVDENFS